MTWIRATVVLGALLIIASLAAQQPPRVSTAEPLPPNPYHEIANWARLPEGRMGGGASGVAIDSKGNLWTMDRCGTNECAYSDMGAILEFDSSGRYVKSIGGGLFASPHYMIIDKDDNLYVDDSGIVNGKGNQITKLSPDGKVLLTLGKKGSPGCEVDNFYLPAGMAVAANGDIFVTDGHGIEPDGGGRYYSGGFANWEQGSRCTDHVRVVKFSKDGKFIKAWGKEGFGPGEFYNPHQIAIDSTGRVFVADRGNNRIQIFDQDGKLLDIWKQFGKAHDLYIDKNDMMYVMDNDSIANMWSWKYSSIGQDACPLCLIKIPRLTDVGTPNPEFEQGIRIGSTKDGVVTAYIPPHYIDNVGPTTLPGAMWTDAQGNLYVGGARSRRDFVTKYVKLPQLPEGAGKQIVQRACNFCHDSMEFSRVNFDRADWERAVNVMAAGGAPITKEEIPAVVDYLSAAFKQTVKGIEVPGPVQASISEWEVPTPNSWPHNILSTRGNGVFYTGLAANVMGKFDPKTQQFKEYRLRPDSSPVGLEEFPHSNFLGTIFFTSRFGGPLGEFHPMPGYMGYWREGDVLVHPIGAGTQMQDIAIGGGEIWFTVRNGKAPYAHQGSKIGSFQQWSTEPRLLDTPTTNADPYGIKLLSDGTPFFTERNSSRIGSVDPVTLQVTEYLLPNPDSRATGITITRDDVVWYTDNARGYLGRFDRKTKKFSEWPSPSGPRSLPDGITHVGNTIWYAEAGSKPSMLVRFDPKTEKFQTWPLKDEAGGGVKHISADRDGSLWLTRPLANRIAHVTIKEGLSASVTGR